MPSLWLDMWQQQLPADPRHPALRAPPPPASSCLLLLLLFFIRAVSCSPSPAHRGIPFYPSSIATALC
eukprot:CAMPEP_0174383652 /NCGR_PEP_ID=MMETSP0811_2-20130205/125387_1 /TAXON_ID=73025 ORGANISM="Eutreptiella gymnastica-like, Strain CCMP1594" /NCGR_SAMPLE_ID=MMETSP0811_2 /ASSEMBLY_ACC=CAM_ASM_000667 /LENGTH=67 /DNA_ID=CAMNT_0015537333 /DNA_START=632 /DNA_END=835 /DNA_ORIENTATION=+